MWMSREEACIVALLIAIQGWLPRALQVNNAKEVACCTRVDCARREAIVVLGKNDCWRHETALLQDRSWWDGRVEARYVSARHEGANNGSQFS